MGETFLLLSSPQPAPINYQTGNSVCASLPLIHSSVLLNSVLAFITPQRLLLQRSPKPPDGQRQWAFMGFNVTTLWPFSSGSSFPSYTSLSSRLSPSPPPPPFQFFHRLVSHQLHEYPWVLWHLMGAHLFCSPSLLSSARGGLCPLARTPASVFSPVSWLQTVFPTLSFSFLITSVCPILTVLNGMFYHL